MSDRNVKLISEDKASNDFEQALSRGFWRSFWGWITQSDTRLMGFDELRKVLPLTGQYDLGSKEIPLDKIVGSVGRYQDFDNAFLPRHPYMRSRWVSVDSAHYQDITLPPIEVYKIDEVYFVKDGNNRVSVAKQQGQVFIDAKVIEIISPVPVSPNTNLEELILKVEAKQFFEQTRLNEFRPDNELQISMPGGYSKLLEHIEVHRWFMGEERKTEVPYAEAVANWYDEVYLPLIEIIDAQNVIDNFPGRTESDLYLWIIEHMWYLREEIKAEVSLEEAAAHYADKYARHGRPFRWLVKLIELAVNNIKGNHDMSLEKSEPDNWEHQVGTESGKIDE
jgi:hypothetical protein